MFIEEIRLYDEAFAIPFWHDKNDRQLVGINVKVRASPRMPQNYQKKLHLIMKHQPGFIELAQRWAWDTCTNEWWHEMRTYALELTLGEVWAAGRSGGYLVLPGFTRAQIEILTTNAHAMCKNCDRPYDQHPRNKCLFDSTNWVTASPNSERILRNIDTFVQHVSASLTPPGPENRLSEAFKTYIDEV